MEIRTSRYERKPKRTPNQRNLRALMWLRLASGCRSSAELWRTNWTYFSPKESALLKLKREFRQASGWEEEEETGAQWSPAAQPASEQSAQPVSEQSEVDDRRRSRTARGRDGSSASHSWHTRSTVPIIANLSVAVTRTSSQRPRDSLAWIALFEMRIYKKRMQINYLYITITVIKIDCVQLQRNELVKYSLCAVIVRDESHNHNTLLLNLNIINKFSIQVTRKTPAHKTCYVPPSVLCQMILQ